MTHWKLGIIGGSGLYDLPGLADIRTRRMETPWGEPSGELTTGRLSGVELVFLPRHGPGHVIPPDAINFRANIAALKLAGCTDILAISACGSLNEQLPPGQFIAVDQYIDRTTSRVNSFFEAGCAAHVSMAEPVCARLSALAADAAEAAGANVTRGGIYLAMEGPQFSSRAESGIYRSWGCDVIGMTNMPEARLAREAELPYAALAMVTDFDSWHETEAAVDVPAVLAVMRQNSALARESIARLAEMVSDIDRTPSPQGIERVLETAIITPADARDANLVARLRSIAGRVL
ncbi:S-methyl-5'-thioadenosine phosphorylase [Hyphobacterium sp.]|uniref:S-methyl-5'-thioadenosine phosphorylase n=1 Tax=Hyphobacterium sp. TaxID=2004662 RepID=UPI003B52FE1C